MTPNSAHRFEHEFVLFNIITITLALVFQVLARCFANEPNTNALEF